MKNHLPIYLLLIFLTATSLKAQQNDVYRDTTKILVKTTPYDMLACMSFEYTLTEGLSLASENYFISCKPYTDRSCFIIQSDDKHFFSAIEICFFPREQFNTNERNELCFNRIKDHLLLMIKECEYGYEKIAIDSLKKNIIYLPSDYTKAFNASWIIAYPLPLIKIDYKTDTEYVHCEALVVHKNDLGPIFFYCFYDEDGYKNRQNYLNKLKDAFEFKDK